MWFVYILKCSDSSYYTGITQDIEKRIVAHNSGKGSNYTKARRPVSLVYAETIDTKRKAEIRERKIKNLSVINKGKIIRQWQVSLGSLRNESN